MSKAESTASLARERARRQNIPVPPCAQQEGKCFRPISGLCLLVVPVDARLKKRTNQNDSAAQKVVQAEIDARPQPAQDDDSFIFGHPTTHPPSRSSGKQLVPLPPNVG